MAEVFVNYRNGDGDAIAEMIAMYLSRRFGKEHVFKASRSIPPGSDYRDALLGGVRECSVLLAVMGPDWPHLERLRDPGDWVRAEIVEALAANKSIVPVLYGRRTEQLRAADLPQELVRLAYANSLRIDTRNGEADLERISQAVIDLVPSLKDVDQSTGPSTEQGTTHNSATQVSGPVIQGNDVGGDQMNVSGTHGPSQLGHGNTQNNFLGVRFRAVQLRRQSLKGLSWLRERFVPPPGFDAAAAILAEHGTLILDGPPGAGRTAAAVMLLESQPEAGRLHELEPQEPNEETSFHLNPESIGPGDRVWANLSDAEWNLWNAIQDELPELQTTIAERHAWLVIIKPYHEELRPQYRQYLKRIDAPQQLHVFRHLLQAERLLQEEGSFPSAKFLAHPRPMSTVQEYVGYVLEAKEETRSEGGLTRWIAIADEKATPREKQVRDALTTLTQPSQRALLLATAMLHGAHADVIERAATSLLISIPEDSDPALKRRPFDERLKEIKAVLNEGGHVRFISPRYESAARAFFWKNFPELHNATETLVCAALDSDGLREGDREDLAHGFAELCLEQRYQSLWIGLVEHLTVGRRSQTRMSAAAAILEHGLGSLEHGRSFRQQVYRWSRDGDTTDSLAEVLVAACEVIAYTHPDEALVRLHHLARRHPRRVGARDALTALARSDPWLLSFLLFRLARMSSDAMWQADVAVFLDIADPALFTTSWPSDRLLTREQVTDHLAAGWALAFTRLSPGSWGPTAGNWLRCAAKDDANRPALLDVLVAGARQRAGVLSTLFGMAHRAEFRDVISGPLLDRISEAQGVNRE